MAHDSDDGRPGLQVLGGVVEREGVLLLLRHDLYVHAEVIRNELDEVIGHGLGDGERGPHEEQSLDDVVGGHAQKLGEVGDGRTLGYPHGVELREILVVLEGFLDALLLGSLRLLLLETLLALPASARGLVRLLNGLAGLLEDVTRARMRILLRLTSHAAVAVLALSVPRGLPALAMSASLRVERGALCRNVRIARPWSGA